MDQIRENINEIIKHDSADRPSLFALQCFVLGKEPTIQAKLWQCVRELKTRKQSLDAIDLEIEEQKDRMELLDIQQERLSSHSVVTCTEKESRAADLAFREDHLQYKKLERQHKATESHISELNQKKKNIEDEALFFTTAFEQLSKRESLKQWDDPDVQKEYWNEKLRQEINMYLLLGQLPTPELMRTVLSLHDDSPIKVKTVEMLTMYNKSRAAIQTKQQESYISDKENPSG